MKAETLNESERKTLTAIRNLISEVARISTVGHLYDFLQEVEFTETIHDGTPSEWVLIDKDKLKEISIPGQAFYYIYTSEENKTMTFKVGDSVWVFKYEGDYNVRN